MTQVHEIQVFVGTDIPDPNEYPHYVIVVPVVHWIKTVLAWWWKMIKGISQNTCNRNNRDIVRRTIRRRVILYLTTDRQRELLQPRFFLFFCITWLQYIYYFYQDWSAERGLELYNMYLCKLPRYQWKGLSLIWVLKLQKYFIVSPSTICMWRFESHQQ